jgi:hypothetical protein
LSILFVLLPWEIGYLLYRGQQETGRLSLRGVIAYRQPMPLRQYIILAPLLIFWYFQISTAWKQLIPSLTAATAGLPRWLTDPRALSAEEPITASGRLVVAVLLGIVASGIVAPIIEELYFRGYLLPRIDRLGVWAVLLNVVLFAFHHLWTPLDNPGRVLAWFPIILVVWWKRNIRLGFIVHLVTNVLGVLSLLSLL